MAGVGHQHAITTCKAEIGGQRSALVAPFFLDDLDQEHLAPMDNVLDFVATAQVEALSAHLIACFGSIGLATTSTPTATAAVIAVFLFFI